MTKQSPDSNAVTDGIRVHARPQYLAEQSDPDQSHYMFAYTITITNEGDDPVRLLDRHWVILDADNRREEVKGPGVVGQTPRILPGKNFTYVSGCPLRTRWGTMEGSYGFQKDDGSRFRVAIGRFFLVSDDAKKKG